MNLFQQWSRISEQHPLSRKILLSSSFAQGHQLLERISMHCGSVLNTEVWTVEALAVQQAGFELFRKGYRYLAPGETFWLVQNLMERLGERPDAYIPAGMLTPGIVSQMHQAVCSLRNALIAGADLRPDLFVTKEKGTYICELLTAYEKRLAEKKAADFAGLLPFLSRMEGDVLFLVPGHLEMNRASRRMLEILADGRVMKLEGERPFYEAEALDTGQDTAEDAGQDAGQDASQERVQEAGQAAGRGTEFFHAVGSAAEIREAFRRMLSSQIPFDRVEIIVSEYDLYAPAVHAWASSLQIPCTFSQGLPLEFTTMGRAALHLLDWIEGGFPVDGLVGMLREGELAFRHEEYSTGAFIRELERSGIGWGRERYLAFTPERVEDERKGIVGALSSVFGDCFQGLPDGAEWSPAHLFHWLVRMLDRYGVRRGEQDVLVLQSVMKHLEILQKVSVSGMPLDLALQYTRRLLSGVRCYVTPMPQPGSIHVTSLSDGGMTGRSVTFLLGMDEHHWSTAVRQDPVLLDEERKGIDPEALPLSAETAARRRTERDSRLGWIRGKRVLSYVSYDPVQKQTQNPAFELLQCFRKVSRNPGADFDELRRHLGRPAGYMAGGKGANTGSNTGANAGANNGEKFVAASRVPLDTSDVWSDVLADGDESGKEALETLESHYPSLGDGRTAATARSAEPLSVYDGYLVELSTELGKREEPDGEDFLRTISVSQLESYAACPLRFCFQYVMKLRPKEMAEFDRKRWLKPTERGELIHRIFFLYFKEASGFTGLTHDRSLLEKVTEQTIEEYARRIPSPSPHVFEKECRDIRADVEVFYRSETAAQSTPRFFELELAVDGEPLAVDLGEGLRIRLKGFVDRIDETGPHQYRIIDYKTGSPRDYRQNAAFAGGTQLQHALYAVAAEQWMRQTGWDPEAEVREAAYYFPTQRGRGQQVVRPQNNRQALASVVGRLLEAMDRGIYVPTKDPNICAWCDYRNVCGRHAEYMKEKRSVPENAALLQTLLEVEEHE